MPAIQSFQTSFYEWSGYGDKVYVGFENYINILKDKMFHQAIINDPKFFHIISSLSLRTRPDDPVSRYLSNKKQKNLQKWFS